MTLKNNSLSWLVLLTLGIGLSLWAVLPRSHAEHLEAKGGPTATRTGAPMKGASPTRTKTATPIPPTSTEGVPTVTATVLITLVPTATPTPAPPVAHVPYPDAPLCPDSGEAHDRSVFHTLWNAALGCHYDHEHGEDPFTQEVASAFPGFDLFALLGNVETGHTNPSGPMENTHKHGGFKWQVTVPAPQGCVLDFEDAAAGVSKAVIQYHNFGDYSVEFETRIHSALFLAELCRPNTDPGYIYTIQHQDYGQRVFQYQGDCLDYPDLACSYDKNLGPYFTADRYGPCFGCRISLAFVRDRNINANSIWTSKGGHTFPSGSTLFNLLFRVRDTYQLLEWASAADGYPYSFGWVCGESAYNPSVCRYNNSTSTVHEVAGIIPEDWDNLAGFDSEPEIGRITAEGYTTRFGELNLSCSEPGFDCHPLKLVRAFVGKYGGELSAAKVTNPNPLDTPERDIYFCGAANCAETSLGAVSSGWIGAEN